MAKKIKDTEYLYLSAYVHAKESGLIGRDSIERMIDSPTPEQAIKILADAGWRVPDGCDAKTLEGILSARRDEAFADMSSLAPNKAMVDVFRIRYDYHNAKAVIKAAALGTDAGGILSKAGRIAPGELKDCFLQERLGSLPSTLGKAMAEAADVLARTSDPQKAEFVLDRAYYAELIAEAESSGSDFILGWAKLGIDGANLKTLVRSFRMKKDNDFIAQALIEGGNVKRMYILASLNNPESALELFAPTPYARTVDMAKAAINGGELAGFEKLSDDVLSSYMAGGKLSAFGEKPLISYLSAVETEINAVRVVMAGQYSHIPPEVTRRRLREVL